MLLHQRHHAAQHRRGQRFARLLDLHHLEAPGQCGVLFEVLLVLAPCGGGDGAQLAAGQRRLEQVGGIALPGLAAGADHGVRLVDEQDDRVRTLPDLVDDVLQAVLEFSLDAGTGLQQPHVERVQLYTSQHIRHVALRDAQRQPLHDSGFADTGFAREDRIVLPAAQQDVDDLADLGIATDHRVDVAIACTRGEVGGELVERGRCRQPGGRRCSVWAGRIQTRGIGKTHVTAFARPFRHAGEIMLELVQPDLREACGPAGGELRQPRFGQECEQQVPAANTGGLGIQGSEQPCVLEQRRQVRGEHGGTRVAAAKARDLGFEVLAQRIDTQAAASGDHHHVALRLLQQGEEQVLQVDFVVAPRQAQVRGTFGRLPAGGVEFPDQGLEVGAHAVRSLRVASMWPPCVCRGATAPGIRYADSWRGPGRWRCRRLAGPGRTPGR